MKLHSQPKTYIITLFATKNLSSMGEYNKNLSQPMLNVLLESLIKYNWSYELFPAQDGYLLTNDHWNSESVKIENHLGMRTTSGAMGCLYSHLQLWKKCVEIQEPIIVLEHDTISISNFPTNFILNSSLVKLGNPFPEHYKFHNITGQWRLGAWSYLITPAGALSLIEGLKKCGTIPTDVLMGKNIIDWKYSDKKLFQLNHESLLQSSTSLRNEKLKNNILVDVNPFNTTEEFKDWLLFLLKDKTLNIQTQNFNLVFSELVSHDKSVFTVKNIKNNSLVSFDITKIIKLSFYDNNRI